MHVFTIVSEYLIVPLSSALRRLSAAQLPFLIVVSKRRWTIYFEVVLDCVYSCFVFFWQKSSVPSHGGQSFRVDVGNVKGWSVFYFLFFLIRHFYRVKPTAVMCSKFFVFLRPCCDYFFYLIEFCIV